MRSTNVIETSDHEWNSLYTIGGIAALIAGVIFRRNLGVEISLFSSQKPPENVMDVFTLLQNQRLLGLAYLNIFDIVNYLLIGVMFIALFVLLRRYNQGLTLLATITGLTGIVIYSATNTALSLLSLSDQYALATTDAQKTVLESAGQALLTLSRFSSGAQPGAGGYLSLLLVALAGMMYSILMYRSGKFNKVTPIVGILATACDLAYCVVYAVIPTSKSGLLAVTFIPVAGLFYMIWHILIGIRLYQIGQVEKKQIQQKPVRG